MSRRKNMQHTTETVGALATRRPISKRVLLRHGIDFCCGGQKPLDEACRLAGVDPDSVMAEIERIEEQLDSSETANVRWDLRPLDELIDHIISRFHRPLRRDLPGSIEAARKVEAAHASNSRCPRGLADHLSRMHDAVEAHLAKEEQILFPLIRAGRGRFAHMPVRMMYEEHEDHGRDLQRLRVLTAGFVAPADACESWRALYAALEQLELDLFEHIHLENNVLFPRALAG
jgi:regulator of cell morphogenesis and NO signaling